jgi:hypothetical protein
VVHKYRCLVASMDAPEVAVAGDNPAVLTVKKPNELRKQSSRRRTALRTLPDAQSRPSSSRVSRGRDHLGSEGLHAVIWLALGSQQRNLQHVEMCVCVKAGLCGSPDSVLGTVVS